MKKSILIIGLSLALFTSLALSADVPMITKEQLKSMLGNPDLVILDFRSLSDYMASDLKIKGAVRHSVSSPGDLTSSYPKEKTLVFYCASSKEETSANMVRGLIERGIPNKVFVLKDGWGEWLKAGYPTEKK